MGGQADTCYIITKLWLVCQYLELDYYKVKMSDADWDADDFEPVEAVKQTPTDKWDGEDEEDNAKDNWDDEDEEDGSGTEKPPAEGAATQVKKKKTLQQKLAEKEAEQRQKAEERRKLEEEARRAHAAMTPEQKAAERARLIQEEKDADLELAKDMMLGDDEKEEATSIDASEPSNKEEFEAFAKLLKEKISKYQDSVHYIFLLESLFRDLSLGVEADDVKKLTSTLNVIANEKSKLEKPKASKKKKAATKASVKGAGKDNTIDGYIDDHDAQYDDIF